jgi:hypothetical protein
MGTTKPSYDMLPPATLEAASRHISLLYQNVIFSDDGQNECADGEGGEGLNGAQHCADRILCDRLTYIQGTQLR